MTENTYIVNNKLVEVNERLKDITFTIEWDLRDSGLNWKYLAKVLIKDPETNTVMIKDYFCSIIRKEKKINYVFLNHLEEKEILKGLGISDVVDKSTLDICEQEQVECLESNLD